MFSCMDERSNTQKIREKLKTFEEEGNHPVISPTMTMPK